MIPAGTVAIITFLYVGLLFAVAYYAEKRRVAGRSIAANSFVYSLSLAVLYTSYTFYGQIGRAATTGIEFLSDSLGNTLMIFTWWAVVRKMVRISKEQNIRSIADFISSRYGKSPLLGGIVTIFIMLAFPPYIALQLKAIAHTFDLLTTPAGAVQRALVPALPFSDTAFVVAVILTLFALLFGARRLDASEHHEGLVAAIALQSVVKLVAFVAVGAFVTYGLFDGFTDIFSRFASQFPDRSHLFLLPTEDVSSGRWFSRLLIGVLAIVFIPRQFHLMVIENTSEENLKQAMWRLPAYAFLFTVFVFPIALGGIILSGGDTAAADFFIIQLPLHAGYPWLALLVFLGGFSASAGMVMVEAVVLSTMILNHLVVPLILKLELKASDLSRILITIKRVGIIAVVFFGYLYYQFISESYALIYTGIVSLIAVVQFAPSIIGGLYWKRATRHGAMAGLVLGFVVWVYTLLIPLFAQSGWLEMDIVEHGLFSLESLRPLELFGLDGLDMVTHAVFWTMFFNIGAFIAISLVIEPDEDDAVQAVKFVDVFREVREEFAPRKRISRAPAIVEFVDLMTKFIGEKHAHAAIAEYLQDKQIDGTGRLSEDELPMLKRFTERVLAGSVGATAAGVIVDSYLMARGSEMEDVFDIFGTVTLGRTASREHLSVLYETAREVATGANLQTTQDRVLDLICQQFKFDLCSIRILDRVKNRLTVRSQKGKTWSLKEAERDVSMETYVGSTFLTNSPVAVNDVDMMSKPLSQQFARHKGIKSFAHAPITIEGNPIGVLSAYSRTAKGIFTEEFMELFQSIAAQIGVAWRNAAQTEALIQAKEQERELQIARTIQLGLLPENVPRLEGINVAGTCVPARMVGGDYYDFLLRGDNLLDVVIADVSGHNIGAALIMVEARTFIQSLSAHTLRPKEVLSSLNEFLYNDLTRSELFITMFYMRLDVSTGGLVFASAGHNPPLLWKPASNSGEWLDAEGLILGVKKGVRFDEKQIRLEPGDLLLLYTDGITEATDFSGALYGEERLRAFLRGHHTLSPQHIIMALLKEVQDFIGSGAFADDVSLVVLKVDDPQGTVHD